VQRQMRRSVSVVGALVFCVLAPTWWATDAGAATNDRSVTYQGLVFSVPRTWPVVSASSGKCLGSRPSLVVGHYTSDSASECSVTTPHVQPSVVMDTLGPPPVGMLFNQHHTTVTRTSHGVPYKLTYGRGTYGIGRNGKRSRPAARRLTGLLLRPEPGVGGFSGLTTAMRIPTSVRRS
jgi:hypothetical protein